MWTMSEKIVVTGMLISSVIDIRWRKVPVRLLLIFSGVVIGMVLFNGNQDCWLLIGGISIGILFFIVSRLTNESIGYADSWMILLLGICQGFWGLLGTLTDAMFLLAIISLALIVVKPKMRKSRLPFLPFLTAGYIFYLLTGV